MDSPTDIATKFAELYDGPPAGVWSAPGRVNLIGEHVDYNEGLVLPFAIGFRTYLAARPRADRTVRIYSRQMGDEVISLELDQLRPGGRTGWEGYVAGVLWAMQVDTGFDIALDGQVPLGAGLSSSASLEAATAVAVNELLDVGLTRRDLVRLAIKAENEFVGAPTGPMDQTASLLCRKGHALLYDVRSEEVDHVPFDPAGAGLSILVIDTKVSHQLATSEYGERRADCEAAAKHLGVLSLREIPPDHLAAALLRLENPRLARRTRHVVTEIGRVEAAVAALRSGNWEGLGRLLDASHRSLRDDFEVSCAELDLAAGSAVAAGAFGARMIGGGFGGSVIALVQDGDRAAIRKTVLAQFSEAGLEAPDLITVSPVEGAGRLT